MEHLTPFLSVVVPVFNEEAFLEELVERLQRSVDCPFEVLFIDDGSSDESYARMKTLCDTRSGVRALKLRRNYGQQNATLAGLLLAGGEWICTMDADLQHPPEAVDTLLSAAGDSLDVVYGVPGNPLRGPLRNTGSRLRDGIFRVLLGKPGGLRLTSFRVIRASAVRNLKAPDSAFVYVSAELLKLTSRLTSVPVPMAASPHKKTGYSIRSLVRLLLNILVTYGNLPVLRRWKRPGPPFVIEEEYPCAL